MPSHFGPPDRSKTTVTALTQMHLLNRILSLDYSNLQVRRVRELAHERLQQISRSIHPVKESYVCRQDHFCGIRFRLGFFRAQWMLNESIIEVFRDAQRIDMINVPDLVESGAAVSTPGTHRRAA